jgi:hypothetical protein
MAQIDQHAFLQCLESRCWQQHQKVAVVAQEAALHQEGQLELGPYLALASLVE